FDGITDPWYNPGDVKGSDTNIQQLNEQERYSWIKAPRWRGNAMEVGPLARTLIAYHKGDAATVESVDRMMSALNLPLSGIQSTLGRILCRAHEAQWAAGKLQYFFDKLMTNLKNGNLARFTPSKMLSVLKCRTTPISSATLCWQRSGATIIWCTSISLPGWTGSMC
uniref:nickel-dependent hydrogenase large subunit n=1 Tax=Rheinheimera sp. TaxID=1869214 RepID=UPI004047AA39